MDYQTLHETLVARVSAIDTLLSDLSSLQTENISGAGSMQQALIRLMEVKFWLQHSIAVLEASKPVEPEVTEVVTPTPTTEPTQTVEQPVSEQPSQEVVSDTVPSVSEQPQQ